MPLFKAVMDSISRWFVGSSKRRTFAPEIIILESMHLTFSPPFTLNREDKVAFVGGNELAKTTLFQILTGEMEPDSGVYKWGITTSQADHHLGEHASDFLTAGEHPHSLYPVVAAKEHTPQERQASFSYAR